MTIPLQAHGLRRSYRRPWRRLPIVAIAEATFELGEGDIACLIGPDGAGKSTLLRLAAGRLRPEAGSILVEGQPAHTDAARRVVGFAPRDPAFPPGLSVYQVLSYGARCHAAGRARRAMVEAAADLAGLGPVSGAYASTLALPDARRLLFALAALGGRSVVLLDEPFAGIDAVTRRDVGERLQRLAARGVTVLLSSSDPIGLESLVDTVLVLRAGRLVQVAPAAALLGGRVLEVVLDAPPRMPPPGFRVTAVGLEADLGPLSAEAALAMCRAHRLTVRGSRVRFKTMEEAAFDAAEVLAR